MPSFTALFNTENRAKESDRKRNLELREFIKKTRSDNPLRKGPKKPRKKKVKSFLERTKDALKNVVKRVKKNVKKQIDYNKNLYGTFDDFVKHNLDLYGSWDDFVSYNRNLYFPPSDDEKIEEEALELVERLIDLSSDRMRDIGRALADGKISVDEFEDLMRDQIKILHTGAGILGSGGLSFIIDDIIEEIEDRIEQQNEFLDDFIEDVRLSLINPLEIEPPNSSWRAGLYAASARGTASQAQRVARAGSQNEEGIQQERRRLGAGDHCRQCPEYEAAGWVPIGTLPAIGWGSDCRQNCNCKFEYRTVDVDEDGNPIVSDQETENA